MILKDFLRKDEFGRFSGIFEVHKPFGISSHQMVNFCRKIFNTKKIGHIGTLDPMASGILHILIGKETRRASELQEKKKTYLFESIIGLSSETFDLDAKNFFFNDSKIIKAVSVRSIQKAIESFKRNYHQTVPIFSSVKIDGMRLHNIARNSEKIDLILEDGVEWVRLVKDGKTREVALPKRKVDIYDLKILEITLVDYLEKQNYIFPKSILLDEVILQLNESQKNLYYKLVEDIKKKSEENLNKIFANFERQITAPFRMQLFKIKLEITVSSGFYVRQFAQDISRQIHPKLGALVVIIYRSKVFF